VDGLAITFGNCSGIAVRFGDSAVGSITVGF
jgi:hypothetical protein